jgi:hypothetical protein
VDFRFFIVSPIHIGISLFFRCSLCFNSSELKYKNTSFKNQKVLDVHWLANLAKIQLISQLVKIWMTESFSCCYSMHWIENEHTRQEINKERRSWRRKYVLQSFDFYLRYLRNALNHKGYLSPIWFPQHSNNFYKLINWAHPMKYRLSQGDLSHYTCQRPNINGFIVIFVSENQLRSSVVSWADVSYIWVFMVFHDLSGTKIAKHNSMLFYQKIMGFYVSVTDLIGMKIKHRTKHLIRKNL